MDKKEESVKSFDDIKNELNKQLTAIKQQEVYINKTDELRKEYEVIINE